MMEFSMFLEVLLSIPKSLYFNLKNFPLRVALKFPILISRRTKIEDISGSIILPETISFGLIKFGFSGSYNMGGEAIFKTKVK